MVKSKGKVHSIIIFSPSCHSKCLNNISYFLEALFHTTKYVPKMTPQDPNICLLYSKEQRFSGELPLSSMKESHRFLGKLSI